jgi:hypothetical protein
MATAKTTTLTFRIEPRLKEALRTAATREHHSIANMVEVLIWGYRGRNSVSIPEQDAHAVTGKLVAGLSYPEPITAGLLMTGANKTISESPSRASAVIM